MHFSYIGNENQDQELDFRKDISVESKAPEVANTSLEQGKHHLASSLFRSFSIYHNATMLSLAMLVHYVSRSCMEIHVHIIPICPKSLTSIGINSSIE